LSALAAVVAVGTLTSAAQEPSTADRVAALKQSLNANQAALRKYTWVETMDVSMKGDVKKHEQKQCYYGADGTVQKTPMPGEAAAPAQRDSGGGGRGGRVKKAVVENKVEDLKDYMQKVVALVHTYVPPDPQKLQAAQVAGNVSMKPGAQNAAALSVKDYAKPGDLLAIGFDTAAKKLTSYSVNSYVEKPNDDVVTLAVTFATLDDGTSYPQQVLLDATAKKVQVKVTNSGYRKSGS
jgi:hypothetical protein